MDGRGGGLEERCGRLDWCRCKCAHVQGLFSLQMRFLSRVQRSLAVVGWGLAGSEAEKENKASRLLNTRVCGGDGDAAGLGTTRLSAAAAAHFPSTSTALLATTARASLAFVRDTKNKDASMQRSHWR